MMEDLCDMQFHSMTFFLFLGILSVLYFILPQKYKWILLLLGSYIFYLKWIPKYGVVLLAATAVAYVAGILIENAKDKWKKPFLILGILGNLGILFLFKYTTFAFYLGNSILSKLQIGTVTNPFTFLVPIGISFYTLQMISYLVDVYRGKNKAERNPFRYALYASFFPIVLSGPFMRYADFTAQTREVHTYSWNRVKNGILLIIWGLFQKMVIADRLSITVNHVFHNYYTYKGFSIALAMIFFTIELYCDFAGYIDIATGAAQILGYRLPQNFHQPFMAASVAEFFRRWHVSFYQYLKEYIYIPLGGNKKGRLYQYVLIFFIFLLSGLWHGASMHFLVWGTVNALLLVAGLFTKPLRKKIIQLLHIHSEAVSYVWGQRILTFCFITFSFVFFRADGVKEAFMMFKSLVGEWNPWILFDGSLFGMGLGTKDFMIVTASIFLFLLIDRLRGSFALRDWLQEQNILFRVLVYACFGLLLVKLSLHGLSDTAFPFIYFQF